MYVCRYKKCTVYTVSGPAGSEVKPSKAKVQRAQYNHIQQYNADTEQVNILPAISLPF